MKTQYIVLALAAIAGIFLFWRYKKSAQAPATGQPGSHTAAGSAAQAPVPAKTSRRYRNSVKISTFSNAPTAVGSVLKPENQWSGRTLVVLPNPVKGLRRGMTINISNSPGGYYDGDHTILDWIQSTESGLQKFCIAVPAANAVGSHYSETAYLHY